jgi:hypothetical protein
VAVPFCLCIFVNLGRRWSVEVGGQELLAVKPANLVVVSAVTATYATCYLAQQPKALHTRNPLMFLRRECCEVALSIVRRESGIFVPDFIDKNTQTHKQPNAFSSPPKNIFTNYMFTTFSLPVRGHLSL